ncbi:MAG: hypothetical protein QM737_23605 [Ferruginibacter sp.]
MNFSRLMLMVVLICFLCPVISCAQPAETYKGKGFSLVYPKEWKTTDEEGILNFFPEDNSGAITISIYSNVNLSIADLKFGILEATGKDTSEVGNVKITTKADLTILYYECVSNNTKWVAKIFKRKNDIFFLTVNSTPVSWIEKKEMFMKVMDSFKLD